MEERLAAYRAKKVKEKEAEKSWFNRLKRYFSPHPPKVDQKSISCLQQSAKAKKINEEDAAAQRISSTSTSNHLTKRRVNTGTDDNSTTVGEHQDAVLQERQVLPVPRGHWWMMFALKTLLWLCVWGIFIELEFGAVFFTVSLLVFIYFNTRTGRKDNKASAYSVFNKDFEQIQGTVTAEQLQQNMFRIPGVTA